VPTIFTHPAIPLAIAPWSRRIPASLVVVAAICSSVPDADVVAFALGIPYEHPLGHRGFTHSICFALLFSAGIAFAYTRMSKRREMFRMAFAFLFVAVMSHGVLDAMTNGGRGVGFFIPISNRRFFFPFRPIQVSPIGATGFSREAGAVLLSELLWVWTPLAAVALLGMLRRRLSR
jgi:inner membrane protein